MTSQNQRFQWEDLPRSLRLATEANLGARVISATTQPGGFTRGAAAVLQLSEGEPVFVKAVPEGNSMTPAYRREARVSAQLPPSVPAPKFRFVLDQSAWTLLCFDAINGRLPEEPWNPVELNTALDAVDALAALMTPSPATDIRSIQDEVGEEFSVWRSLATKGQAGESFRVDQLAPALRARVDAMASMEAEWEAEARGDTLLHFDLRHDNMLIDSHDKLWIIDWSWPAVGASWIDLATFLPTTGLSASELQRVWMERSTTKDLPDRTGDAYLSALAGTWLGLSTNPPPAHAPHLREHQARCASATLAWLAERGL